MSIYATLWEIKVRKCHSFDDEWIEVFAQAVHAHIGHPSAGYADDPYSDFLPPVVAYDPAEEGDQVERAVVIVAEGRDQKVGQQYVDPLVTLTGQEYRSMSFPALLRLIETKLPWDRSVIACRVGPDGSRQIVRRS
jgi:hypothetical protein